MCPPNQFTWGIFASTGLATRQLVHGVAVNMALLAIGTTSKDALIMISQVQQDFWLPSEMWCGCSLEGMYMAAIHVMGPLIRFVIFGFPANIMYYYILLYYIYIVPVGVTWSHYWYIQGSYGYQLAATADTYLYWDPRSVTWLKFGPGGFHALDFKS